MIESLNVWGAQFVDFALPILWQSSLLMAVVFAFDFLLRRKIRPAVRYTLWFVIFIKLLIPPTLALPTSAAWWLRMRRVEVITPQPRTMVVSYSEPTATFVPSRAPVVHYSPPPPQLSREAWMLLSSICVSALLGAWSVFRWRQIARCIRETIAASGELKEMFAEIRSRAGVRKMVRLQLTGESMSPAVCGLFRPVVLLPQSLIERLDRNQLRAVLLHELIHLRRRDVWVNCAQTLLQIIYWWHPLLWFANARIRRVREEAVDDAVMFALNEEAEIYAPTLLEVAKLAFNRPLATLGLVGILESRNALRHRIERLLNFSAPRKVGVSVMSVLGIAAFTALAVPMGEPPARIVQSNGIVDSEKLMTDKAQNSLAKTGILTGPQFKTVLKSLQNREHAALQPETASTAPELLGYDNLDIIVPQIQSGGVPLTGQSPLPRSRLREVVQNSVVWDGQPVVLAGETNENVQRQQDKVPFLGDLPEVGRLFRSGTNGTGMTDATNLHSFTFQIGREATSRLLTKFAAEHPVEGPTNSAAVMKKFLENAGVDLTPPKSFYYEEANGNLTLHARTKDLQKAAVALHLTGNTEQLREDGKLLYQLGKYDQAEAKLNEVLAVRPDDQAALYYLSQIKRAKTNGPVDGRNATTAGQLPAPNLYARTNKIYTSPERQKIYDKLNAIHFDKVTYPGLSLSEVIQNLTEMTKRRDVDQQGINFLLNNTKPHTGANGQSQDFDPTTGQPIAATATANTNEVDLRTVTISLDPGLENVRLLDVLEAITKSADHPIKYSILDYGIEFSLKGPEVLQLHTRTFKLDPNTFYMGLQSVSTINFGSGGNSGGGQSPASIPHVNVTGNTGSTGSGGAGTNRGLRYVTGLAPTTEIQLAVINFFTTIGVNLKAPKSVFFNDRQGTLTVHATDDDLDLIEQAINTLNIAPPEVTVKVRFVEADDDFLMELFGNGVDGVSTNFGWTGILTEPKFKAILKSLQNREHATLLEEGEVTTLSGRQANFQVMDVKTILTAINATETNKVVTYSYGMTNNPYGTTLDIVPVVNADGYTIHMTVVPTVTEFLGYENPKDYVKYDKNLKNAKLPLPKSRVRQMSTSANVWDGQTLVLGNLSDESVVTEPNGAKLVQPIKNKKKKQLVVFITPVIIDPTGNRVHSKDYYDGPNM
jgi:beta-lactamase regulating signal transducer with metallopeptidase domain/type II secretory pathway component GspD/PulD (secretin)